MVMGHGVVNVPVNHKEVEGAFGRDHQGHRELLVRQVAEEYWLIVQNGTKKVDFASVQLRMGFPY